MSAEERFISLRPPTPQDAGQRFLQFLHEELTERGVERSLLALYATQEGATIRLWTFFDGNELAEDAPQRGAVYDAEVKINAGYFTPALSQRPFSIEIRALPAQGQTLDELEKSYFAGNQAVVRIYLSQE